MVFQAETKLSLLNSSTDYLISKSLLRKAIQEYFIRHIHDNYMGHTVNYDLP